MVALTYLPHPSCLRNSRDWIKWRSVYEGGETFLDDYLQKFSNREDDMDFKIRKSLTPIPTFAKAAIKDVRNSIFQRMAGISRTGGSAAYMKAVKGEGLGVDNLGSSMTSFLGKRVLDELLVMGVVGIYVDAPALSQPSIMEAQEFKPYIYAYRVEDIVNWVKNDPSRPSEFQSILLRETVEVFDSDYGMPTGTKQRMRRVWIDEVSGKVNVSFIEDGEETPPVELNLTKIPFVMLDLGDSLIKDVANHQIALLNLWSSNVYYSVQSGFPIYTEQRDSRDVGGHLKQKNNNGTASTGGQGAADNEIRVGVARGRSYDMNAERPGFISPSSDPLMTSMDLCERLKKDVRELINLAVVNLGVQASAESKNMDNSGLEAGLSFIGLVLETAERSIAEMWAAYESTQPAQRKVASVSYPERWSLKSDQERTKDATELNDLVSKMPSRKAKRETLKILLQTLLGSKVSTSVMDEILKEIDSVKFTTSDPDTIQMAKEQGMLSSATGAEALGFDREEAEKAEEEHQRRMAEIAKSQSTGIQGVPDTQARPKQENQQAQEPEAE